MSNLTIKVAAPSDSARISDFICEHFNGNEPIQLFHARKEEEMDPPPGELIDECIAAETLLLAYKNDELVGVIIACEITPTSGERDLELAKDFGQKGAEVFALLSYIETKADTCNKLNVDRSLHIHIVSVHKNFLRQGIAKKLFASAIEVGRVKQFPAASVDCTSHFTSLIAETFGMNCISTVTYDEYNQRIGKQLFAPVAPHTEIKTYARLYASNADSN